MRTHVVPLPFADAIPCAAGITGASISILKSVRYSAGDNNRLDESRILHLSFGGSDGGFPVKAKDKGRVSISFTVPSDLKPTIRARLIEVTYMLNVVVKFPGYGDVDHIPERSKRVWLIRKDSAPETLDDSLSQRDLSALLMSRFRSDCLLMGGGLPLPPT